MISELSTSQVTQLKKYKSPGINHSLAELIQAGSEILTSMQVFYKTELQ
jgi:hypothetical protein